MVPRAATEGSQMAYDDYRCLRVRLDRGVAFVTIDHPPINLLDLALMRELDAIGKELEVDDAVRVVVFDSADPDFFIAHADVALIERLPTDVPKPTKLGFFHAMVERFRTMPKATIGKIEGRARGGGSELLLSLAKAAVDAAELPTTQGLLEEADAFNRTLGTSAARRRMGRFLELGGQTRAVELDLGRLVERLAE